MTGADLQPDRELTAEQAQRLVTLWLGDGATCTGAQRLTGGMVNSVFRLHVDRVPHAAVVKLHEPGGDGFAAEARALRRLGATTGCPVPSVHLHDSTGTGLPHAFLLLEHVDGTCLRGLDLSPAERADLDRQLGRVLAGLHERTAASWGGITTEEQTAPWPEVMAERLRSVRARPTVGERLAPEVLSRVDRAIGLAPLVLEGGGPGVPTLVHGDVWDGNVIVRRHEGRWRLAALLDPAAEFADPEMELAYVEVFDQPRPALREVYDQRHPPRPGHERRRLVYWLHTALLHVALFELEVFRVFAARYADDLLATD